MTSKIEEYKELTKEDFETWIVPREKEKEYDKNPIHISQLVKNINNYLKNQGYIITEEYLSQEIMHQRVKSYIFTREVVKTTNGNQEAIYKGIQLKSNAEIKIKDVELKKILVIKSKS